MPQKGMCTRFRHAIHRLQFPQHEVGGEAGSIRLGNASMSEWSASHEGEPSARVTVCPVNGAESLIQTLIGCGLDVCFANPGTTELPMVRAMDDVPGMRAILCLFEGVCTGAADGYARMAERPGLTLLHLGPGFANGIACLHDARRARSAIVNVIGDHATWHLSADAPLTSDI